MKKTKKPTKKVHPQKSTSDYTNKRIGIIKDVRFGQLPGSMLGAFAVVHDGGFGMSLSIVDIQNLYPLSCSIKSGECEQFFKDAGVIWHEELKGKHVLLLSNSEAINSVDKVVPHKELIKLLEEDK